MRSRWASACSAAAACVRRPGVARGRRRSGPARGRAPRRATTRWRAVSGPISGSSPLLDGRGLERGEQHDERAVPAERVDRADQRVPVGLGEHRLAARPSRPAGRPTRVAPVAALDPAPHRRGRRRRSRPGRRRARPARPAAARRPSPSRGAGCRRPGRPRCARCRARAPPGGPARAARCGPRRPAAGAGPPVDAADVVAADVLAQRVELRALAAHPHRRPPVELAQPGQPAGQVLAGVERRQHAHRARAPASVPCRAASPSGPRRAHRDPVGTPVAAAGRARRSWSSTSVRRRRRGRAGAGCRSRRPTAATRRAAARGARRRRCCAPRASSRSARPARTGPAARRTTDERRARRGEQHVERRTSSTTSTSQSQHRAAAAGAAGPRRCRAAPAPGPAR